MLGSEPSLFRIQDVPICMRSSLTQSYPPSLPAPPPSHAMSRFDQPFDHLQLQCEATPSGTILWITLNRPRSFNAINMEMLGELHTVLDLLPHPTSCLRPLRPDHPRVVVIKAAGRAFSAGVDIKVHAIVVGVASALRLLHYCWSQPPAASSPPLLVSHPAARRPPTAASAGRPGTTRICVPSSFWRA